MTTQATHPPRSAENQPVLGRRDSLALANVLGRDADARELPAMWHLAAFAAPPLRAALGHDGHPLDGIPAPPAEPHRRMFAGGRVTHHSLLRFGEAVDRVSVEVHRTVKEGRSGRLEFVTVRNEYRQGEALRIVDEHDIVYRPLQAGPAVTARPDPVTAERLQGALSFLVDPVTLFLFSAATGNAHRIHYDLPFAAAEGHPGLVVHGPLQVILMVESLVRCGTELLGRTVDYRLLAPAWGEQELTVGAPESGDADVVVVAADGRRVARATVLQ